MRHEAPDSTALFDAVKRSLAEEKIAAAEEQLATLVRIHPTSAEILWLTGLVHPAQRKANIEELAAAAAHHTLIPLHYPQFAPAPPPPQRTGVAVLGVCLLITLFSLIYSQTANIRFTWAAWLCLLGLLLLPLWIVYTLTSMLLWNDCIEQLTIEFQAITKEYWTWLFVSADYTRHTYFGEEARPAPYCAADTQLLTTINEATAGFAYICSAITYTQNNPLAPVALTLRTILGISFTFSLRNFLYLRHMHKQSTQYLDSLEKVFSHLDDRDAKDQVILEAIQAAIQDRIAATKTTISTFCEEAQVTNYVFFDEYLSLYKIIEEAPRIKQKIEQCLATDWSTLVALYQQNSIAHARLHEIEAHIRDIAAARHKAQATLKNLAKDVDGLEQELLHHFLQYTDTQ